MATLKTSLASSALIVPESTNRTKSSPSSWRATTSVVPGHNTSPSASMMTNSAATAASTVLGFVTGNTVTHSSPSANADNDASNATKDTSGSNSAAATSNQQLSRVAGAAGGTAVAPQDPYAWTRAGRPFSSHKEVYTRSLFRLCLKFTTSEDEDEGKPEPATAFWTLYSRPTTIGNAGPTSTIPDSICRRMDDSMTGPAAGVLSRIVDADGEPATRLALAAGMTTGWQIRGDRGDAAVRVGKARVIPTNSSATKHANSAAAAATGSADTSPGREAEILSLDADRWVLNKGASFCAGNSVFVVDDFNEAKQKLTLQCTKGPMKNKSVDIHASRCPFVFGRAHEADLCIMDRELSRRHGAVLFVANRNAKRNSGNSTNNTKGSTQPPGVFILVDLESTNGSYMRLVGPYALKGAGALGIGDEFIVGRTGFSVNRFDYGISEAIGARPTMEDRTIVLQTLMLDPKSGHYLNEPKDELQELAMTSFAAVFDGHGGDECSNYLEEQLPNYLRSAMLAERVSLRAAVEQSRANNRQDQTEDAASELMRKIIKGAYLRADKDFITPKNAPQSGSTAATVLLFGRRLFAANVGDSRVVLCRGGGQCVELTSDHKPSRPDEAARVRAAGGFILHKRVMGELAITRAFGDKSFKLGIKAMLEEEAEELENGGSGGGSNEQVSDLTAPLVSAEPEIASMILSHNDEFLLLACDGLFDVFRSQDAIALARQELISHKGEPAEVARILSDQAIRVRRSRDNVSILIIVLRPFWEHS